MWTLSRVRENTTSVTFARRCELRRSQAGRGHGQKSQTSRRPTTANSNRRRATVRLIDAPGLALASVRLVNKKHLSYENLSPSEARAWKIARVLVPRQRRWFFEGCREVPGQLWYTDRKALYAAVRAARPNTAFEVGTWRGGGSTLFIAQALSDNSRGLLHTIEIDPELVESARSGYDRYLPHLTEYVTFHEGSSTGIYPSLLQHTKTVDFLFLDGKEDANETYREFLMFEPFLRSGSVVAAHDWGTDKAARVRQHVENSSEWEVESVLAPPRSVGLAIVKRR
jgi:predicted O-methyltransferase YrrM